MKRVFFVVALFVAVALSTQSVVMAQSNSIQLRNGAYSTTLISNSDATTSVIYTLPVSDGSNGQVLTTNASGILSWATATGGASSINGLSDARSGGADFTGSLLLGHNLVAPGSGGDGADYNTGVGLGDVIRYITTGDYNTALGYNALAGVNAGSYNTALGYNALAVVTTGNFNVAVGTESLVSINGGGANIGIGSTAGRQITSGERNVSVGHEAGFGITTGNDNISIGYGIHRDGQESGFNGATGSYNIGIGSAAMYNGAEGSYNIAIGQQALRYIKGGNANIAIGDYAAFSMSDGSDNIAVGQQAGYTLSDGSANVVIGQQAGYSLLHGLQNVLIGHNAGRYLTGSGNVLLGYQVGYDNTLVSYDNLLMIDNSNTLTPLIQGDFSANTLTFNGATTTTGDVTVGGGASASEVRLLEPLGIGSHYTAFKAQTQSSNITYTLPATIGTANQVLSLQNTDGTLEWATASGGGASAINDLTDAVKNIDQFTNSMILGHQTTGTLSAASNNTAVGMAAMDAITEGDDNTVLGYNAATALTEGSQNVTIGSGAGSGLTLGSGNVLVGYNVGSGLTTTSNMLYIDNSSTTLPLIQGDFLQDTLRFNGSTTTSGKTVYEPPTTANAKSVTANTSTGAGAEDIATFTNTYEKVAVTATSSAGFVQLPAGTDGQVVYLRLAFTASGSNTVTVVNSNNNNTAMVYDGTGSDVIVAHMIYTTGEGWVVFSALEYDN